MRIIITIILIAAMSIIMQQTALADPDDYPEYEGVEGEQQAEEPEGNEFEYFSPDLGETQNFDHFNLSDMLPASVTGERFQGLGTLVDMMIADQRVFYTIVTREGNAFYLIIDFDRDSYNVHFLAQISQYDLPTLTDNEIEAFPPRPEPLPQVPAEQPELADYGAEQAEEGGVNSGLILMLAMFGIMGLVAGFGYYKKVYKKKKGKPEVEDGDPDENEDIDSLMENDEDNDYFDIDDDEYDE